MLVRNRAARWAACPRIASCVVFCVALALPVCANASRRADNPIGMHSMLFLGHEFSAKDAMFREAAQVGASEIRLDIAMSIVFATPDGTPDWHAVDEYMLLARRYHLRVLANLLATPWYLAACPPGVSIGDSYRCPASDPARWAEQVGAIARHTRGAIDDFEIVNEPDGSWAFIGSPQQYAAMLTAASDAIHAANPAARVAIGGLMDVGDRGRQWMDTMLASLPPLTRAFDIANIHVRGPAAETARTVARWRRYFARAGFHGPLWVTEAGYPADVSQQTDSHYRGGPKAQARYLRAVIPAMIEAGAAKVFISERDAMDGMFASEGILDTSDPLEAQPVYWRRPSFYVVRAIARRRG